MGTLSLAKDIYLFSGRLFKSEITQELLCHLRTISFPDEARRQFAEGFKMISTYLSKGTLDPVTELATDYAGLFLGSEGPVTQSGTQPYESVHTSSNGLIMQKARDQVAAIYRANDLDLVNNLNIPEDHIGLELDFMAFLCRQVRDAQARNQSDILASLYRKREFLQNHILNWIPDFCRNVEKNANTTFYKGLARLTRIFIRIDSDSTNKLITELDSNRIDTGQRAENSTTTPLPKSTRTTSIYPAQ